MTTAPQLPLAYPPTRRADQVDDYHGTPVADPYRWLEDPDSAETRSWIADENALTESFLADIPQREAIRRRLTELWDYERYGLPFKRGDRYFYSKNDGLQNQSVLYWTPRLDGEPVLLLDPNTLSEDGTVALSGLDISEDGRLMAYGLSSAGSDWQEWRVREVESGADRPDVVRWVKFSGASWTKAGDGFFYSRYDEPEEGAELLEVNRFQKLYFHRLGMSQEQDTLVYERSDQPDWGFAGGVTDDGRYLVITVWEGTRRENGVFYRDLSDPAAPVVELLADFDASYSLIDNDGPLFWFQTDLDAPRGRIIAIDTSEPARDRWREVVPQAAETLEGVGLVGERFIALYLEDAHSRVRLFDLDGRHERDLALPALGSAGGFGGRRDERETFFVFTSYTSPSTIYRHDLTTGKTTLYRAPAVPFDTSAYETVQVFYQSKDGARIPMFLTHKRGLTLDGNNPTYLTGYGGFGISLTPEFSVSALVWLELGGVYAVANLRGGGEYGEDWHQAGMLDRKQNVFDDCIAAAEWLIANGYTSSSKLAIAGGSNGGLLVGACLTQRPELFAAALPSVGVMDMLRFHTFTIGWAWTSDYGSPDDPAAFPTLYAYSPLHNLRPGVAYPATLILTADHDDRVAPAHSFKFAAALQAAQAGPAPVLIRIETRAGHGGGKPTAKVIEEAADKWAFLCRVLRVTSDEWDRRQG